MNQSLQKVGSGPRLGASFGGLLGLAVSFGVSWGSFET